MAQKPRCKEFAAQQRNREVPNSTKVGIIHCAKKDSRRSRAISKPTLNMGQQQLPRKNSAAKNFRRSGVIAKPKIKHKSATITAQNRDAKNLRRSGAIERSPKFNEGRHYLLRKTALQRIRGAAAQSHSQH